MYRTIFSVLILIGVGAIWIAPVIGEVEELTHDEMITVTTSQMIYEENDNIIISGKVLTIFKDTPITIQIFHNDVLVDIAQVSIAQDRLFTNSFRATGPMWKTDGEYLVRAQYGVNDIAETKFEFFTKATSETSSIFEIDIPNSGTFDVNYTIKGGKVTNMELEKERLAVIIEIETNSNGWIIVELPRDGIDAKKQDHADEQFIVLINVDDEWIETSYGELSTTKENRTIKIDFEQNDKKIEIIGTFVVPEFGAIATMILIVAILSVITITKMKLDVIKN